MTFNWLIDISTVIIIITSTIVIYSFSEMIIHSLDFTKNNPQYNSKIALARQTVVENNLLFDLSASMVLISHSMVILHSLVNYSYEGVYVGINTALVSIVIGVFIITIKISFTIQQQKWN